MHERGFTHVTAKMAKAHIRGRALPPRPRGRKEGQPRTMNATGIVRHQPVLVQKEICPSCDVLVTQFGWCRCR
jgi:hypothetical protein